MTDLVAPDVAVIYEGTFTNGNASNPNGPLGGNAGPVDVAGYTGAILYLLGNITTGIELQIVHYDGAGNSLFLETVEIHNDMPTIGGANIVIPFHGAQCQITFATLGGTHSVRFRTLLTRRPMRYTAPHSLGLPPAVATSNGQPAGVMLNVQSLAVANGAVSAEFTLPFFIGWAELHFEASNPVTTGTTAVILRYYDSGGAVRLFRRWNVPCNVAGQPLDTTQRIWLPGGKSTVQMQNYNTGASTLSMSVVADPL